jgi:transcriptional regulator with XRE-family HTH domain
VTLGPTIRSLRDEAGLSQAVLAKRADISAPFLSQIEAGAREPSLATVRALGDALGVPAPFLILFSVDLSDVPESKRDAFEVVFPALRTFARSVLDEARATPA